MVIGIGGCKSIRIEIEDDGWYGCPLRCAYEGSCFWATGSLARGYREGGIEEIRRRLEFHWDNPDRPAGFAGAYPDEVAQ